MADSETDDSRESHSHLDDAGGGCAELWEQAFDLRHNGDDEDE